jgi:hypothetical protein
VLHVVGARPRRNELDLVVDTAHSGDARGDELRFVTLVLPVGLPAERDAAVLGLRVDRRRDEAVQRKRLQHGAAEVGVVAPVVVQNPHLQFVVDALDAVHALSVLLCLALHPQAADRSAQRHDAVVGEHADFAGIDLRVPQKLVADIGF